MPKVNRKSRPLVKAADLRNLRASGLTDKTIRANKLRTEAGAMVIPYRNLQGEVNGFARKRLHTPRLIDGKKAKYTQPRGSAVRAYFPAACVSKLRNGRGVVFITEGEKKALALAQEGHTAIGLGGIYNWKNRGTDDLIDDLAAIDWEGRKVNIVFDFDEKPETRHHVDTARKRLAKALRIAGANEVFDVKLPPGPRGCKLGADDFIVANGAEAFNELVEQAEPVPAIRAFGSVPSKTNKVIKIIKPELGSDAYHGQIGNFLKTVGQHTEATEPGILAHILPAVCTLIGPGPHVFAGSRQPARLSTVVVGPTNSGRKGTASAPVEMCMERVDPSFWSTQRVSGLSSGEGLIEKVADIRERNEDGVWEITPVEKRLYALEPEFSRVLANIRREGNILSQVIRESYDSGNLSTLTVNPRVANGAHISIVAHITPEELAERLSRIEMANGFGNRFLWFYSESDKIIAHTKPFPDSLFRPFEKRLRTLAHLGSKNKSLSITFDSDAARLWEELYPKLRKDRAGMAGAMTARGSGMVIRIALAYCLVDRWKSATRPVGIGIEHLLAASEVWRYCEESAYLLFDQNRHDPLAAKLLRLLGDGPKTKTDLNKHLSPKQKSFVRDTLTSLEQAGQIRKLDLKRKGAGRPSTKWELVE